MNIKVICTWTISGEEEGVNAGATPIKLMIQERVRIQERKKAAEEINERLRKMEKYKIIKRWQVIWDKTTNVSQWTKCLLPYIRKWLECKRTWLFS